MPELLTYTQAAKVLGVSRMTVSDMVAAGQLKTVDLAGKQRPRVTRRSIDAFVQGGESAVTHEPARAMPRGFIKEAAGA